MNSMSFCHASSSIRSRDMRTCSLNSATIASSTTKSGVSSRGFDVALGAIRVSPVREKRCAKVSNSCRV